MSFSTTDRPISRGLALPMNIVPTPKFLATEMSARGTSSASCTTGVARRAMMMSRFCAATSCSSWDRLAPTERTTLMMNHCSPRSCARRLAAVMILTASREVIETAAPMLICVARAPGGVYWLNRYHLAWSRRRERCCASSA